VIGRRFSGAVVGVFALAASAWAQDYTITAATGKLETRPADAVGLQMTNSNSSSGVRVDLPFDFLYYGRIVTGFFVAPAGFIVPNATQSWINSSLPGNGPGHDLTSGAFPYQTPLNPNIGNADGVIAPFWTSFNIYQGSSVATGSDTYYWVGGTAPQRRFVVSWEGASGGTTAKQFTAQVQLYEGTGRIVFAYAQPQSWSTGFASGFDSFGDTRFTNPTGITSGTSNLAFPSSDFVFDPRSVSYSGTLLFDRIVSDANGIGSSTDANRPLAGIRVELRRDGGVPAAAAVTAADGSFTISGIGIASTSTGTLTAMAQNAATKVSVVNGGPLYVWDASTNLSYSSGSVIGTQTLGASSDSTGVLRGAFNIARACLAAYAWASPRTSDVIPQLDARIDNRTAYAGSMLFVNGSISGDNDLWDDGVITMNYGRHVLASIAGAPATVTDAGFGVVSDTQNAFAAGFGAYVWSVVSGGSTVIDGKSPTSATVYSFETPPDTAPKGPDVADCMAGALCDLADSANETIDAVDGTLTPERPLQVADAITVAPTAATFLQRWVDAGHGGSGITRVFVGNGALADDPSEPNDDATESAPLGAAGVKRSGLVLNRFNQDWFSVTLSAAAAALVADATYDRVSFGTVVGVEIRSAGGSLIASGVPVGTTGPIRATTGPLAPGTYRIGVTHASEVTLPTYTVQTYLPLAVGSGPVKDWTVGRDFDQSLDIAGGVPPYFATGTGALPPGILFSPLDQHVVGTPTTPGTFLFTTQVTDDGSPSNLVSRSEQVVIHDVLKLVIARYVGFPMARGLDLRLPTTGGTPPFTLTTPVGALPDGLAFAPGTFDVTGTAAAQPSVTLELDAVDVAGSADHVATRAVVAVAADVPNAPAALAAGEDACGWWFDAVQGSAVSFKVKTAKGAVKRLLTGAVLAPDRSEVLTATVKGKLGGLSVSKLVCPLSGRYYVVAASDAGEATQLLGNVGVKLPKSGKAKLVDFTQTATTEVEVGALPGAVLTLKMKGDKKQQLTPKVVSVTKPDGTPVVFGGNVVTDGFNATLTMTFAEGGTWTVVVGATSATGTPGKLSYSYKIAQPKDVAYSAD
jgi:hypothetical protein